jgi:hypothetical protein
MPRPYFAPPLTPLPDAAMSLITTIRFAILLVCTPGYLPESSENISDDILAA